MTLLRELLQLTEATTKATWSEVVKKYSMVNGKRYHDSGTMPKLIKNKQGVTLVHIDKDGNDFRVEADKLVTPNKKNDLKNFKSVAELDTYLATLKLDAEHPKADDAAICKFIGKTYMCKVKNIQELKDEWTFIKWPDSIQLQDNDGVAIYTTLVNSTGHDDDDTGIGELGMTIPELQAWLLDKGVKQKQKPKRIRSGSYYD